MITDFKHERGTALATLKYSRQREAIQQYLSSTKEHPTAEMIYLHVKQVIPQISLGTVYRNLQLLTSLGEIQKIPSLDGADRYDAVVQPHNHFICKRCGCVKDLHTDFEQMQKIQEIAANSFEGEIESSTTTFYGVCVACSKSEV
jgi:Fur family peroxide stress response transcriptional regulator